MAPEQDSEEDVFTSLRKRAIDELETVPELDETPTKRRRADFLAVNGDYTDTDDLDATPNGKLSLHETSGQDASPSKSVGTPQATPRRRGRPPKASKPNETPSGRKARIVNPETPTRGVDSAFTTPRKQAADRSARKKSARALIENITSNISDDEEDYDGLAREIYESSDAEDEDDVETDGLTQESTAGEEAATPSKTQKRRGRPKRIKSPTPPRDLPPHEQYFVHNKPGRPKTSDNNLSSLSLLSHEEYFSILRTYKDRHEPDIEYLQSLHAESFPQWAFEAMHGFNLCLYGYGSKRALLRKFAKHLYSKEAHKERSKTVIVNGYTDTTTIREVLSVIGSAVSPSQRIPISQPTLMAQQITSHLNATDTWLTLIVNSIDAAPLRKPGTQAALAQLASHHRVKLVCSADTPDFPLLWDVGLRSAFNFVFHDCTTFVPLTVELDVVDEVHELLGRKAHRINGREGVAFVLKSLPENAKNLFRLLVGEVLVAMEENGGGMIGEDPEGVEYRMLYNKAVEEFICSSEVAFRTLLKE